MSVWEEESRGNFDFRLKAFFVHQQSISGTLLCFYKVHKPRNLRGIISTPLAVVQFLDLGVCSRVSG